MPKRKRVQARAYYKPEPFPLELDELNLNAKTKSGLNIKIVTQKDTTLKRFDKVKNPNLVVLADFQNGKIYLKRADGSLWLFAHSDKGTVWIKLHNYIMEILEAFSILHHRRFDSFIPKQIWVNRNLKARMLKMLRILENEGMLANLNNNSSRKSREKTIVFSNSINSKAYSDRETSDD